MKALGYVHCLNALKLPSRQYRRQIGYDIGGVRLDRTLLFTFSNDTSTRGHIYKLYKQHAPIRDREQSFGVCIVN